MQISPLMLVHSDVWNLKYILFTGRGNGNNVQTADIHGTAERESNSILHSVTAPGLTPTASLAELMLSARQMLIEQVGESLLVYAESLSFYIITRQGSPIGQREHWEVWS